MLKNIESCYYPLFALLAIIIVQIFWGLSAYSAAFLIFIAYVQNAAYSLQSRSRLRDSNLYHAIAAIAASFIFFTTLRFLVTQNMPFQLLTVYVFGTVLGTLNGNVLSMWIEKHIKATSQESSKNKSQFAKFWPSMAVLVFMLGIEVGILPNSPKVLLLLALLAFLDNFSFSVITVTRNADNHWIHLGAILFQSIVKFASLKILIGEQMSWILFIPNLTGGVIGSISGAEFAKQLKNKIGASNDAHVKEGRVISSPAWPIAAGAALMALQFVWFGYFRIAEALVLFVVVIGQNAAFSLVSRARQRNNKAYLVYTSFLSNGIWYAIMHLLAIGNVPDYLFIPNTSASVIGGLAGQDISMRIEKSIGAVMDEFTPVSVQKQTAQ